MDFMVLHNILEITRNLGLSSNEANVYINLLKLGANPVSTVAKNAGVNRSNCYGVLEKLFGGGYVQKVRQNGLIYYRATPINTLINKLKDQRSELDEKINKFSNAVQMFEQVFQESKRRANVVFYEGVDGVKNIMEDTLNMKSKLMRAYASMSELEALLPNYFLNYYRRRVFRQIHVKAIYPADELSFRNKLHDEDELRKTRLIPKEFDFHLDVLIYDHKIAITSLTEKFGVLIENVEMAKAHAKIFDFIWEGAKEYDERVMEMLKRQYMTHPEFAAIMQQKKLLASYKSDKDKHNQKINKVTILQKNNPSNFLKN